MSQHGDRLPALDGVVEAGLGTPSEPMLGEMLTTVGSMRRHLNRFMASYKFAMQEVETKVKILRQEFELLNRPNPIEHVSCRLKTLESVVTKARQRGCGPSTDEIRRAVQDIAGVRVVCSFVSDVYRVQEMLCSHADVELLAIKDYIAHPKPSGYRSLHAIIEVPVFLSDAVISVPVEMQFRTVAQDFWACLEHKIFYKYDREIPAGLSARLQDAALTAAHLDAEMERLSIEIDEFAASSAPDAPAVHTVTDASVASFLELLATHRERGLDAGQVDGTGGDPWD